MSLRTEHTENLYRIAQYNKWFRPLNEERPVYRYKYWIVVKNRFPHDLHHTTNHILVLDRKCSSILKVRLWEWRELRKIYRELSSEYDKVGINMPGMMSVTDFVHFHLYVLKEEYK